MESVHPRGDDADRRAGPWLPAPRGMAGAGHPGVRAALRGHQDSAGASSNHGRREVMWRQFATAFSGPRGPNIVTGDFANPEGSWSELFRMQTTEPGLLLSPSCAAPGRRLLSVEEPSGKWVTGYCTLPHPARTRSSAAGSPDWAQSGSSRRTAAPRWRARRSATAWSGWPARAPWAGPSGPTEVLIADRDGRPLPPGEV
jgi:hypothetical protein